MKNSERPINPILDFKSVFRGLTKREYFAGLAMQGMLANKDVINMVSIKTAERAIEYADELLKQLQND